MIKSSNLNQFKGLFHGFSTISDGNFKTLEQKAVTSLGFANKSLILAEQVHGNKIGIVSNNVSETLKDVDGLVTKIKGLILGIKAADCLPIILYEPMSEIIGIAHAGWRGTLVNISQNIVISMEQLGANRKNIIAVLGPHIRDCCYIIDEQRKNLFEQRLASQGLPLRGYLTSKNNKFYLSLAKINIDQLKRVGLKKTNIEEIRLCTYHRPELFFSFRRQAKESGRMLNFLCLLT
ncbi:peptidoglycan editing factor PgeF [Candidatus Gottesmanbacteria bacterium]|nr:peptidoglycan editing factor PgeF [Candidatus Gottesmanbacteria bacterium]